MTQINNIGFPVLWGFIWSLNSCIHTGTLTTLSLWLAKNLWLCLERWEDQIAISTTYSLTWGWLLLINGDLCGLVCPQQNHNDVNGFYQATRVRTTLPGTHTGSGSLGCPSTNHTLPTFTRRTIHHLVLLLLLATTCCHWSPSSLSPACIPALTEAAVFD